MTTVRTLTPNALELLGQLFLDCDLGMSVVDADGCYILVNERAPAQHAQTLEPERVVGQTRSLSRQAQRRVAAAIAEVREHGHPLKNVAITDRGLEWEADFYPLQIGDVWACGIVARDVTGSRSTVLELEQRGEQRAAIAAITYRALQVEDPQELFEEAVELLARALDVELASVLEVQAGEQVLVHRAGVGWADPVSGWTTELPVARASPVGHVVSTEAPVLFAHLAGERRFRAPALLIEHGVESGMCVPIATRGGLWGVLEVYSRHRRLFTEADELLLATLASVLGSSVERALGVAEIKRISLQRAHLVTVALEAEERERRRIAELLHDEVLQLLLYARQEVAMLFKSRGGRRSSDAIDSLAEAVTVLRQVVAEMHPVAGAPLNLRLALELVGRELSARGCRTVDVLVAPDADSRHDRLVVAAVRELGNNVVKHAPGASASILVSTRSGALDVEVSDDGPGLGPGRLRKALVEGHIGLPSLIERVEANGGHTEITKGRAGAGTSVRVTLPLP